jgi:hypothetical protein
MVILIHIYPQIFSRIHKEKSSKKESTSTPLLLFIPFKNLTSTTHPSVTFSNELTGSSENHRVQCASATLGMKDLL